MELAAPTQQIVVDQAVADRQAQQQAQQAQQTRALLVATLFLTELPTHAHQAGAAEQEVSEAMVLQIPLVLVVSALPLKLLVLL